jgi:hypothetical protein
LAVGVILTTIRSNIYSAITPRQWHFNPAAIVHSLNYIAAINSSRHFTIILLFDCRHQRQQQQYDNSCTNGISPTLGQLKPSYLLFGLLASAATTAKPPASALHGATQAYHIGTTLGRPQPLDLFIYYYSSFWSPASADQWQQLQ